MASAVSPSSLPSRLPSPPPIAEDQIGPKSPGIQLLEENGQLSALSQDAGAAQRRIRPGTKAEDMAEGPPLIELQEIDSAFQITEHLRALHYARTHPEGTMSTVPITTEMAKELATPPSNTSREIWLYELGRFLIQKTNSIIVGLFADDPPCSPQTCPEMRASEWQYLCAVHDPPKSCSAIDYCCHTLDWAATSLTSSKMFPSRLGLGSSTTSTTGDKVLQQQMKELTNIFRRVYRIYAHAWFQHREMFWRVESKTGLYVLFKIVCDQYGLIPPENYTIPPEAEGQEPDVDQELSQLPAATSILKRGDDDDFQPSNKSETTKRHPRHTYNNSTSVSSIIQEEAEDDEGEHVEKRVLDRQTTALNLAAETDIDESTDDVDVTAIIADPSLTVDLPAPLQLPETEETADSADTADTADATDTVDKEVPAASQAS